MARWAQARGLRHRSLYLSPDALRMIDRSCQRHGLRLSAWAERMAAWDLAARLPDAPFADHIPYDYRKPEAIAELMEFVIDQLAATAEARKQQVRRVERQHPKDFARIRQVRHDADLAWNALAWMQGMDAEQALREHRFGPGGLEPRKGGHRRPAAVAGAATPPRSAAPPAPAPQSPAAATP
jgi:hypothetical protein